MKKEHMLLAGAGALGLLYLLSRGAKGDTPMMFEGGGGLDPGLETITTETITIPAGGEEIGGSILLPPPEPGKFFQPPEWIRPEPRGYAFTGKDYPAYQKTLTKKELQTDIVKSIEYRRAHDLPGAVPYAIDYVPPGGYSAGVAAPSKKESLTSQLWSGAKMGAAGSIPGQLISKIWSWF